VLSECWGVSMFIHDVRPMFFNPILKGTTRFSNVTFTTWALYFVYSIIFVMVKFVFIISHLMFNSLWWLERGCDLFLTKYFFNPVNHYLNVRKLSWHTRRMVVQGSRPITCSLQGFSYHILNSFFLVTYDIEDLKEVIFFMF